MKVRDMKNQVGQILFSCTLNAVRSVMAEAFFNRMAPAGWISVSCGVIAGPADGFTLAVMEEKEISIDINRKSKIFSDFDSNQIDYAISLSVEAQYHLDNWDKSVPQEHWIVKEPFSADESREAQLVHYRLIRDEISTHVDELIKRIGNNT